MTFSHINNQKGYSLVSTVMAAGIMTTILLTTTAHMVQMTKHANSLERRLDRANIKQEIENYFSNENACTNILKGQPAVIDQTLVFNDPTGSSSAWLMPYSSDNSNSDNNLSFYGKHKVTSLKFKEVNELENSLFLGSIEMKLLPIAGDTTQPYLNHYNIYFTKDDSGNINDCYSKTSTLGGSIEFCESLSGTYNTETKKCDGIGTSTASADVCSADNCSGLCINNVCETKVWKWMAPGGNSYDPCGCTGNGGNCSYISLVNTSCGITGRICQDGSAAIKCTQL